MTVTSHAVGSYPTVSPLPAAASGRLGGLFSVPLSVAPQATEVARLTPGR